MITTLGLEPHPEGGHFRRTYTSPVGVETGGGIRAAATLIHFFLPAGDVSAWHQVSSDEVWLWHGPGHLRLQLGGDGPDPVEGDVIEMGLSDGVRVAQALVPGGVWQRTLPGADDVLVSCLVSPGFDFADFRLAD